MARTRAITAIGYLFIVVGLVGFAYHLPELATEEVEVLWVLLLRLLAIVGGVFLLKGANWARWLLMAWLAYHLVLSAWHSVWEVIVHAVFLLVIGYFLLGAPPPVSFGRPTRSRD